MRIGLGNDLLRIFVHIREVSPYPADVDCGASKDFPRLPRGVLPHPKYRSHSHKAISGSDFLAVTKLLKLTHNGTGLFWLLVLEAGKLKVGRLHLAKTLCCFKALKKAGKQVHVRKQGGIRGGPTVLITILWLGGGSVLVRPCLLQQGYSLWAYGDHFLSKHHTPLPGPYRLTDISWCKKHSVQLQKSP